jgi:integrase
LHTFNINLNGKKERKREPVGSRRDEAVALLHEYRLLVKSGIDPSEKRRNIRMNRTFFEMLARRRKTSKSEYVFPSPRTGGRLDNVRRSFASALQRAGIENFRFHDLRHSAASWMVQGGADIYAVQKILGHSHVRTTQRYNISRPNTWRAK